MSARKENAADFQWFNLLFILGKYKDIEQELLVVNEAKIKFEERQPYSETFVCFRRLKWKV